MICVCGGGLGWIVFVGSLFAVIEQFMGFVDFELACGFCAVGRGGYNNNNNNNDNNNNNNKFLVPKITQILFLRAISHNTQI